MTAHPHPPSPSPVPPSHPALPVAAGWRLARPALHGVLAGLAAAAGSLAVPDRYRSEARILPDLGRAAVVAPSRTGVWAPSATPDGVGTREDGPTVIYADILRSRRVAERVLRRPYAYRDRGWALGRTWPVRGDLAGYLGGAGVEASLGPLRKVLAVDRDLRSGLLTLSAETRSPELSLQVVQEAREALRDALLDLARAAGRDRARFTLERLEAVRGRYREAADALGAFQGAHRDWAASPDPDVRFRGGELRREVDLWGGVAANLTLGHEQAVMEASNDTQALLVLDPGSLPERKSGPPRAFWTLAAALLGGAASFTVCNRRTLLQRLTPKERP